MIELRSECGLRLRLGRIRVDHMQFLDAAMMHALGTMCSVRTAEEQAGCVQLRGALQGFCAPWQLLAVHERDILHGQASWEGAAGMMPHSRVSKLERGRGLHAKLQVTDDAVQV